jgi:NADPH2:quinone reductase
MRAVVYENTGGPDVLHCEEVPDPQPGVGQVLVDVQAVGVNYRDIYERQGGGHGPRTPPAILGVEGAGTVVETGERVAWIGVAGSSAEQVAAPAASLVPVPDDVSLEVAAAAILQGMTAHYLAWDSYPVAPGDWTLVHAAAGGVGRLLTQLVRLRGGRVVATTSTAAKAKSVRELGAEEVIEYDGFAVRARQVTGGAGVAVVYDGVGRTTFRDGFAALQPTGRMILYGASSGQPDPVQLDWLRTYDSVYLQRPTLGSYTRTPELLRERASQLFELISKGQLDVHIGGRFHLEDAARAHEALESRTTVGKLLLLV